MKNKIILCLCLTLMAYLPCSYALGEWVDVKFLNADTEKTLSLGAKGGHYFVASSSKHIIVSLRNPTEQSFIAQIQTDQTPWNQLSFYVIAPKTITTVKISSPKQPIKVGIYKTPETVPVSTSIILRKEAQPFARSPLPISSTPDEILSVKVEVL